MELFFRLVAWLFVAIICFYLFRELWRSFQKWGTEKEAIALKQREQQREEEEAAERIRRTSVLKTIPYTDPNLTDRSLQLHTLGEAGVQSIPTMIGSGFLATLDSGSMFRVGNRNVFTNPSQSALSSFIRYALDTITSDQVTPAMIYTERNAEIRRHLLEKYGFGRFMEDMNAEVIATDEAGELLRFPMPVTQGGSYHAVRVKNSTPESDGTFKYYTLRVPPNFTTPREAIAWTFNMTADEYTPVIET